MRTNIVLNDDLVTEAMRYSRAKTKRGLVEEALETFVRVKEDEKRRATYRERLREVQNRTRNLNLGESAADILRADRDRR